MQIKGFFLGGGGGGGQGVWHVQMANAEFDDYI